MAPLNNLVNGLFDGTVRTVANVGREVGNYASDIGRYVRNNPMESLGYAARNGLKGGILTTLLFIGCKIGDATPVQYPTKTPIEYPTSTAPVATIVPTPEVEATIKAIDEQLERLGTPIPASTPYTLQECKVNLQQVKSGTISPKAYLQDLEQCTPEVVNAKNSGMLKGFSYQPSDKELGNLLRELFSGRTNDEPTLQYLVQSSTDSYKSLKGTEVGALVPGTIDAFGQRVPIYIAFTEKLFSSPEINNDADIKSIVKHELQHVDDWYKGITLNGTYLSSDTISPSTLRIDFLQQLMELRAVYRELEDIFREKVETDRVSVSPQWFGSQASNYSTHWESLRYPTTELEEKTRKFQFEQFTGIVPERSNNEILLIRFNLFGKQDTALIRKTR